MEKAFDRVWHAGLLYKLSKLKVPRRIVRVVASFLEQRKFQVVVEDQISTEHPVEAGVPQGSCLSPTLYSSYTDDIPVPENATLALYADDAAYICTSLTSKHAALKMQRALDGLQDWLQKWRLVVNVEKTQALKLGKLTRNTPNLKIYGRETEWTHSCKYLGVHIDCKLQMVKQAVHAINQTTAARTLLYPIFTSKLPVKQKLAIYKTYVRPHLTYAAPSWFQLLNKRYKKKIEAQQNKTLRLLLDAPRYVKNSVILRDLHGETVEDFVKRTSTNMFGRTSRSNFPHLQNLAPWTATDAQQLPYPRDIPRQEVGGIT